MELNTGLNPQRSKNHVMAVQYEGNVEILQMDQQELNNYIEQQVLENPVMETEPDYDALEEREKIRRKLDWIEEPEVENRVYYELESEEQSLEVAEASFIQTRPEGYLVKCLTSPDILVVKFKDYFEVLLNETVYPRISVSSYYRDMLHTTRDNEIREYLEEKLQKANHLIMAITRRNEILIDAAKEIVAMQKAFFSKGSVYREHRCMREVWDRLGMEEELFKRIIRNKWLQCTWGIYPLLYFFE